MTETELRILFPDGTDLDEPDEATLRKHFSINGVEWVDSTTFGFINLEENASGDDYLEVYTEDNAHSATDVMDAATYNREYTIEYWISDVSLCEVDSTSQITVKKSFVLKITPFNHPPEITGTPDNMRAVVFELWEAGDEYTLPAYTDEDPLEVLTPYFRFPTNQSDFDVNFWIE